MKVLNFKNFIKNYKDKIPGGKGDKTDPSEVDQDELKVGIEVEKEHVGEDTEEAIKKATEIALDHLSENPKYYSELIASGIVDEKPALELAKELGWIEKPKYEYGCVMIYFNFPEMKEFHSMIDEEDLLNGKDSLEDEPHVTLLYGLHSDEISDEDVMKAVNKDDITDLILHNVSAFKNDDQDVLKFEVKGEGLHSNNEKLKEFPYTSNFPEYNPHSTIAYLKPGTADKYIELFKGKKFKVSPSELVYSKPGDEEKTKIREKF